MQFFDQIFLGNSLRNWLLALGTALLLTGILWIVKHIWIARLAAFADKSKNRIDNVVALILERVNFYLMAVLAIYAGSSFLSFSATVELWIGRAALFAFLFQVALWGDTLVIFWIRNYERDHTDDSGHVTTLRVASFMIRLVLFVIIILLALDNMGVKITSLVASLGIGTIAVALAVQNILADLFASLSIALDQPFVIGDFIIVDDKLGTVEKIGLKTTRLRSLSGEQLVFSNNDLLQSRIHNYKRMGERRVVFSFGVTYQTSPDMLEKIQVMVRETIEAQSPIRFDRAHFKSFGDSALIFEVVYYVLSPDYTIYMDIQQAINLTLMRLFERDGIEFAYPTQTIFLAK